MTMTSMTSTNDDEQATAAEARPVNPTRGVDRRPLPVVGELLVGRVAAGARSLSVTVAKLDPNATRHRKNALVVLGVEAEDGGLLGKMHLSEARLLALVQVLVRAREVAFAHFEERPPTNPFDTLLVFVTRLRSRRPKYRELAAAARALDRAVAKTPEGSPLPSPSSRPPRPTSVADAVRASRPAEPQHELLTRRIFESAERAAAAAVENDRAGMHVLLSEIEADAEHLDRLRTQLARSAS
jgi:hypothetical protein